MTLKELLPYMVYHTVSIYEKTKKGKSFVGDILANCEVIK